MERGKGCKLILGLEGFVYRVRFPQFFAWRLWVFFVDFLFGFGSVISQNEFSQ